MNQKVTLNHYEEMWLSLVYRFDVMSFFMNKK